jgi:hypothetical protein
MSEQNLKTSKKVQDFIRFVKSDLLEYSFKLEITRGNFVNNGGHRVSGIFDENNKFLRVGGKHHSWLSILVHEYAHFIQWKTQAIEFTDMFINGVDCNQIVDMWINGCDEFRPTTVKRAFIKVRRLERNCEMLALNIIRRYELPINRKRFVRQANCHIYYYHMMEMTRKRWIKDSMFESVAISRLMPVTFRKNTVHHIPPDILDVASRTF